MTTKPNNLKAIYDYRAKDPECLERYTFVYKPERFGIPHRDNNGRILYDCLGTSETGLGTSETGLGISQHGECIMGKHLGKRVKWDDINPELQRHVAARMFDNENLGRIAS